MTSGTLLDTYAPSTEVRSRFAPKTQPRPRPDIRTRPVVRALEGHVCFATSCTPGAEPEAIREFPFYESLAQTIEQQVGVGTFLPHRDVSQSLLPNEVYAQVHRNIINSYLVVGDVGTPSTDAGIMIKIGADATVPILPFYRSTRIPDPQATPLCRFPSIVVASDEQGIRDIVSIVRKVYGK